MNSIRTIIIDDERSAREELKRALAAFPQFDIVGEAGNADEAESQIQELHPDLLFLDIQMPGRSGFELLESLPVIPAVIFVTAFDRFALRAFEVSAIDYLLKPVRDERFAKAVREAAQRIRNSNESFFFIKDGAKYHFARWSEAALIESADAYVCIHMRDKKPLLKTSLIQLEAALDPVHFFRANRQQLINLRFISSIHNKEGILHAMLTTGQQVVFSERQSAAFKKTQQNL
ncbi:LytR/AlgR family response regulator transcription factor [Sediminibacterium ginsengisoli]|uniref:Two component transcriptional regulator, LytTR family n=1 Tax=Sediminibacterium ginsengisoli TaxID=413434 RepID=A0A1T4M8B0_9BACT|nr:response regulator transcription factor [Sediminibacterium ginsengisoli]SJZ63239.1 two component transcriptional regulator, LytTR family [Sediminibacterium ginsengisoli]